MFTSNSNATHASNALSPSQMWRTPTLNKLGNVSQLTESGSNIGVETLVGPKNACLSPASRAGNNTAQC